MIEQIGFKFTKEVDPFAGGPHYRCNVEDIKIFRESISSKIVYRNTKNPYNSITSFASNESFFCTHSFCNKQNNNELFFDKKS